MAEEQKILKLFAIKTLKGYYISDSVKSYSSSSYIKEYFFDGKKPEPSFDGAWFILKKLPKKIEKEVSQPNINYRYELIEDSLVGESLPKIMPREEVATYSKCDFGWVWKDEYKNLRSLYKEVSDKQPNIMEGVPFEITEIVEFDKIKQYGGFSYPVQKEGAWGGHEFGAVTQKDAISQFLDKLVFPKLLLPGRPCRLSVKDSYRIIRKHIQDNIDPKWAHITSDYDFCLSVKKKIRLIEKEPYTITTGKGRRKRIENRLRDDREIMIYETSPEGYSHYPTTKAFEGKNHEDLKKNIDKFLKDLMDEINEPLMDCPHCKGQGVIEIKQKKKQNAQNNQQ